MKIITKRGDDGYTDVMYGGRMPKTAPAVAACGAVDELNSSLGMVRVSIPNDVIVTQIDHIQGRLVGLMGLLSVPAEKRSKYLDDGYPGITEGDIKWLEQIADGISINLEGWARPGASGDHGAAWLDVARAVCRRAELLAWQLGEEVPVEVCRYLNRLSDILWMWARRLEEQSR